MNEEIGVRIEQCLARGLTPDGILLELPGVTMKQIVKAEGRIDIAQRMLDGRVAFCARGHDLRPEGAKDSKNMCVECRRRRDREKQRRLRKLNGPPRRQKSDRPSNCKGCARTLRHYKHAAIESTVAHKGRGYCSTCYERWVLREGKAA